MTVSSAKHVLVKKPNTGITEVNDEINECYNREFTQRQEYDYDYVNGCLKGLGLIVIVIVSLNVGLR